MIDEIPTATHVARLAGFGLVTQDADRLMGFYAAAFDCRELARDRIMHDGNGEGSGDGGGDSALRVTLTLGDALIEVLQFDQPGRAYLPQLSPFDSEFQHFAIVVADMNAAYERLCSLRGWSPISSAGPQRLPESSGAVEAFKFRDPDGHPLELLNFPQQSMPAHWRNRQDGQLFLGIDHSAISVADSARSVAFYQALGLQVVACTHNQGIEQQRLDGIDAAQVDVSALAPPSPTPHVELLCYRNAQRGRTQPIHGNDVSATRLIFESDKAYGTHLLDPDGHHLYIRNTIS